MRKTAIWISVLLLGAGAGPRKLPEETIFQEMRILFCWAAKRFQFQPIRRTS
jgi:hypothetical protein